MPGSADATRAYQTTFICKALCATPNMHFLRVREVPWSSHSWIPASCLRKGTAQSREICFATPVPPRSRAGTLPSATNSRHPHQGTRWGQQVSTQRAGGSPWAWGRGFRAGGAWGDAKSRPRCTGVQSGTPLGWWVPCGHHNTGAMGQGVQGWGGRRGRAMAAGTWLILPAQPAQVLLLSAVAELVRPPTLKTFLVGFFLQSYSVFQLLQLHKVLQNGTLHIGLCVCFQWTELSSNFSSSFI